MSAGFWKPAGVGRHSDSANAKANKTKDISTQRRGPPTSSVVTQRSLLPIYRHRKSILYAVEHYGVVILVGETGCGKSTQLPQYLYECGWCSSNYQVVCTQPRRVAAETLATRVAVEVEEGRFSSSPPTVGGTVGFAVRFDVRFSEETRILFVTDGWLVREATLRDPLLSRFSVVVVDEAHERNRNTDVLLGILRKIRRLRPQLRVIVCSATLDAPAFLEFLAKGPDDDADDMHDDNLRKTTKKKDDGESASTNTNEQRKKRRTRWGTVNTAENETAREPNSQEKTVSYRPYDGTIISVDGRQYPVDVFYVEKPVPNYVRATVDTALSIPPGGDILCFLPSSEDVDNAVRMAQESLDQSPDGNKKITLLPLYSTLPYALQQRVFDVATTTGRKKNQIRRIIFATNIAETSVTVPHVTAVVDCGFAKVPYFDARTGLDRLVVTPISQASARQRAGRAGRLGPGQCYRLYRQVDFDRTFSTTAPPELVRSNLTAYVLQLKALGIRNILAFDVMDVPSVPALAHALESLHALGAMEGEGTMALTPLGQDMSTFPAEPRVARMLLESVNRRCTTDVLSIAAVLQVAPQFWMLPKSPAQRTAFETAVLRDLAHISGDHLTFANVLRQYDQGLLPSEADCRERFIHYGAFRRALEIRRQLSRMLRTYERRRERQADSEDDDDDDDEEVRSVQVRKCITSGFFFHICKRGNDGRYYTLRGKHMVALSSSSILHFLWNQSTVVPHHHGSRKRRQEAEGGEGEYILFGETQDGSRGGLEVRCCTLIKGAWLRELAPHYWE